LFGPWERIVIRTSNERLAACPSAVDSTAPFVVKVILEKQPSVVLAPSTSTPKRSGKGPVDAHMSKVSCRGSGPVMVSPGSRTAPRRTLKTGLNCPAGSVVVVVVVVVVAGGCVVGGVVVVGEAGSPSEPPAARATPPPTTAAPPRAMAAVAPAPSPPAAAPAAAKPAGTLGKTATPAPLANGATMAFVAQSDALATTSASLSGVRLAANCRSNAST
jgi:hypothetical protein